MENNQSLAFIFTAISQVGFPIVLTGYLLLRFEKKLEHLTQTISKLIDVIHKKVSGEGNDG
ncbi:YvrJ family protein [Paenibacillus bouchesdurhonensis]|uniref:YvrJ family protein n=1 Tax=Paenibacillus bouchesdurhonensis TaxID=1870990 RepID=UPI000DA62A75|nr:YvrJ family protein [Paenibacillus bouchesdurhonensis]